MIILLRRIRKEETVRRVVFVLASGLALVLTLGATFLDLNVSLAQPVEKPPLGAADCERVQIREQEYCKNTIHGTSGDDVRVGSKDPRLADMMWGHGGDDRLHGHHGNDGIHGGFGQDVIYGGQGYDGLFGDAGRDTIYGGPGPDEIYAQDRERDIISCGLGVDSLKGYDAKDVLEKNCESPPVNLADFGLWAAIMGGE
jgi:Ca2+-binding RTX toxin-like protein